MILIAHYTELIILQVSIIIISIVTCEDEYIDYDLPTKYDSSYTEYHFRPYSRYDQQKMDPDKFFKSIYNLHYRLLPEPHVLQNYDLYKYHFSRKEKEVSVKHLSEIYSESLEREYSPDAESNTYAYFDPNHYQKTHEMFYESTIHATHMKTAREYKKNNEKPLALDEKSFVNILQLFELLPKYYEHGKTFYEARVKLGKFILNNTPSLEKSPEIIFDDRVCYGYPELIELSTKDVLIRGETYEQYAIRMAYLGKVPLDPETCDVLYKTNFSGTNSVNRAYMDSKLNFTPPPLQESLSSTEYQLLLSDTEPVSYGKLSDHQHKPSNYKLASTSNPGEPQISNPTQLLSSNQTKSESSRDDTVKRSSSSRSIVRN